MKDEISVNMNQYSKCHIYEGYNYTEMTSAFGLLMNWAKILLFDKFYSV